MIRARETVHGCVVSCASDSFESVESAIVVGKEQIGLVGFVEAVEIETVVAIVAIVAMAVSVEIVVEAEVVEDVEAVEVVEAAEVVGTKVVAVVANVMAEQHGSA